MVPADTTEAGSDEGASPAATTAGTPAPASSSEVDENLEVQLGAERVMLRSGLFGAAVGMVVGAGVWMLIVTIAVVGSGWSMGPIVAMGAVVGMFAGAFYGGWAGAVRGNLTLEKAEHRALPALPESAGPDA